MRQGERLVFRGKIDCTHNIRYVIELGKAFPLITGGASGTAILAGMADSEVETVLAEGGFEQHTPISLTDADAFRRTIAADRQLGYSVSRGRWVRNGAGVSAPFFGPHGACVGALTLSCPADRLEPVLIPEVGTAVLDASRRLSRRIGYLGWWALRAVCVSSGALLSRRTRLCGSLPTRRVHGYATARPLAGL